MNKARIDSSEIFTRLEKRKDMVKYEKVVHKMRLAARIADAIAVSGMSKKQFAQCLGKQPSEISKWLSGTHNFTTDTLIKISSVLHIELVNDKKLMPVKKIQFSDNQLAEIRYAKKRLRFSSKGEYSYRFI